MSKQLNQIIALFLVELIILLPITLVDALTISNVQAQDITQDSATIKWETSEQSRGAVSYGNSTELDNSASTKNFVENHSIQIGGLLEDTIYYYEVSADNNTATIVDNNSGSFYTFTTLPPIPLFINATIPEYYNNRKMQISGESIRYARIYMYVNNKTGKTLYADENSQFIFRNVDVDEGENTIKFTAESQGETVENTYTITIDTVIPTVTMDEIPDVVMEKLIINGSVSEEVNLSFYVTSSKADTTPPPKITNLINTSIQANLIEFAWDEINITDFAKYIIYRDNKAISVVNDIDYNEYTDVFVNSNATYTYEIAGMDLKGNIGDRSDALTVTAKAGGVTDREEHDEADIFEDMGSLIKTITTDEDFEEEIEIGDEDGYYIIRIEAVDKANNQWTYEKEVLLDMDPPEIEINSPETNAEIYETYADMVTLTGETEPGARVYLYVQRTPLGEFNISADIYGLADEIQEIPELDLGAGCTLSVYGEDHCKTHADYDTVADANGYFEFENVDLTSMWGGALRISEYTTGAAYYDDVDQEKLKDYMESSLSFVAVDNAGRKGVEQVSYRIVSCWTSDLTWDATPLPEYQSPSFLNIERLKEGSEVIYFYFNFTYHGSERDAKVTNINLASACGSGYLEDQERYNYSCSILGSCTEKLSKNGKTVYVACPLKRLDGVEKWRDQEWKSFIDAVRNEMTFPFKMTLTYDEYATNNSVTRGQSHSLCAEVGYVVDAAFINPKDVLPDWMLYDLVDFLNETIAQLNDWIIQIRKILEWAAIGCMVSFLVKFVTQIYRRITCHYDRYFKSLKKIAGTDQQQEDECKQCIQLNQANPDKLIEKFGKKDIQDMLSDTCLEKCYPSCASAWESEASLYRTYRWACDRVFGHAAPSKWTESINDEKLHQKLTSGSGCANDESVRGRPLRAIKCQSVEEKYRIKKGTFDQDDKCLEIKNTGIKESTLYQIGDQYSGNSDVYEITSKSGPDTIKYTHVIKQNDNNYLAAMQETCEQICQGQISGKVEKGLKTTTGTKVVEVKSGGVQVQQSSKKNPKDKKAKDNIPASGCITTNECLSYKDTHGKLKVGKDDLQVKTATPMGYTRDCFSAGTVSSKPDTRIECCCINSKPEPFPQYYKPADVEKKGGQGKAVEYDEMEWSYRYSKINYNAESGATKYNPNRYISGRDVMACFGQNNILYDSTTSSGEVGNLLIVDPMKQHVAAFQCVAISQILNRLYLLKNMMVALMNCLLTIRVEGRADTGVCKEIFSQYICAFIWKVITWITDGCLPWGSGVDFTKSENEVLEAVSVGMKGVWDSVADSQQELASEYGNAQLNNLVGMGEEDVFRKVCLAAFGYDWELSLDSLMDVAYNTPYATLVQAILPSREYLTFDPTNAKAKYEYRSGWLINPGCDLDSYQVYLACVTRNDMYSHSDINCQKQSDPWGVNCDCLDLESSKTTSFYQSRGSLPQNSLIDIGSSQITDRIKTSKYRYDHLMFKLNVDRNIVKNKGDVSKCFPDGHEDGIFYSPITDYTAREIAGCTVDATTGVFSCREGASFFNDQGSATIDGVDLKKDGSFDDYPLDEGDKYAKTYYLGETITGSVKYSKDANVQCLAIRLYDQSNQPFTTGKKKETKIYKLSSAAEGAVQTFTTSYKVDAGDISASAISGTVEEVGSQVGFSSGLNPVSGSCTMEKQSKTYTIRFYDTDTNKDGKGDRFKIETNTGSVDTKEGKTGSGTTICLNGFAVQFIDPIVDPKKAATEKTYQIKTSTGKTGTTETGETIWNLHIDIRSPKEDDDCNAVKDHEYDDRVVVADQISQSIEIPIKLDPNKRSSKACADESSTHKLEAGTECICEKNGKKYDCPTDGGYNYCVDHKCRRYPKCTGTTTDEGEKEPCVCGSTVTNLDQYNCAYDSKKDSDFIKNGNQKAKYCIKNECKETKGGDEDKKPVIVLSGSKVADKSLLKHQDKDREDRVDLTKEGELSQPINIQITADNAPTKISISIDGGGSKDIPTTCEDLGGTNRKKCTGQINGLKSEQAYTLEIKAVNKDNQESDPITVFIKTGK